MMVLFLASCTNQDIVVLPEEETIESEQNQTTLPLHEASSDAEIEFSQALDNLLNDIENEQE